MGIIYKAVTPNCLQRSQAVFNPLLSSSSGKDRPFVCKFVVYRLFDNPNSRGHTLRRRACSASFSDEEFTKQIEELAQSFNLSDDPTFAVSKIPRNSRYQKSESLSNVAFTTPFSPSKLDSFEGTGDPPAYSSVKKAFSSMVFIIRELHSYALQMRETLLYEDLQGIITRVQRDMHASFVWLFQHVFSRTPTLMVYVMILLVNFTLHSMAENTAIAISTPSHGITAGTVPITGEKQSQEQPKFDSLTIKTFSGELQRVNDSGTGGGDRQLGRSKPSIQYPNVVPDEIHEGMMGEEEVRLWDSVVEEGLKMQAESRGEALDHETMRRFVSPVSVELEPDDYVEYFRTDLLYQMGVSEEPSNPLLLSNYAQFLYLVAHDHDRAEECFKRAVMVEPPDAEAMSQYANFLWIVRKDLWGAEERYQQAMVVDPGNPYHASKYANFLWSTGGEDTCFPLNSSKNS